MYAPKKGHVRRCLSASREEASGETNPASMLILNIKPPELLENKFQLLSYPVYGICYGSPSEDIDQPLI